MKKLKLIHVFQVREVRYGRPPSSQFCIYGESFFAARARYCAETPGVEPDEVRPVQPARAT